MQIFPTISFYSCCCPFSLFPKTDLLVIVYIGPNLTIRMPITNRVFLPTPETSIQKIHEGCITAKCITKICMSHK